MFLPFALQDKVFKYESSWWVREVKHNDKEEIIGVEFRYISGKTDIFFNNGLSYFTINKTEVSSKLFDCLLNYKQLPKPQEMEIILLDRSYLPIIKKFINSFPVINILPGKNDYSKL